MPHKKTSAETALLLAPLGRDAAVAASILGEAQILARIAGDLPDLVAALREGAGFAIVTEEALRARDLRDLALFIGSQPEWSDMPFIVLTARGGGLERNPDATRLLEMLGNVTFLERPFHPTTLVSLAKSALRARRRQYDARQRLEAIREAQDRLTLALAAGGLGAWELDVKTMVLKASAECKAHFGCAPEQPFSYQDLLMAVHPDDRAYVQAAIALCQEAGDDYSVDYRCIWPDGSVHWVQMVGRLEANGEAPPARVVGVSQDISDRKQDEVALRAFAIEMERQVDERTREREAVIAQLHEAQKLETLGQLTGGVAHDFNNLLTPVIGNLDILRRIHQDKRSQRLISGALQASERARTLISRLLAFARRQNLEARAVDVEALLEGMLDLVRRSLGPQIAIKVDIGTGIPAARVDPNQLELALLNLAVNARDAMPTGGTLSFTLSSAEMVSPNDHGLDAGRYVTIMISDTGTGMDEATLRRAVEPFYSTKGIGKGTGLGLSMVHGLAAQSGGALRLDSEVNVGTTATLWLPMADAPSEARSGASDDTGPAIEPLRILVVDDEELVRRGTADMLADMGHEVLQATSGAQALQMLRDGRFDFLVSDYLMPSMNGLELIEELRRQRNDIPILLITGFADYDATSEAEFGRLAKPFRRKELAAALAAQYRPHEVS